MAQNHIADLNCRLAAADRAVAEARPGSAASFKLQVVSEREADMRRRPQAEAVAQAQREAQTGAPEAITADWPSSASSPCARSTTHAEKPGQTASDAPSSRNN